MAYLSKKPLFLVHNFPLTIHSIVVDGLFFGYNTVSVTRAEKSGVHLHGFGVARTDFIKALTSVCANIGRICSFGVTIRNESDSYVNSGSATERPEGSYVTPIALSLLFADSGISPARLEKVLFCFSVGEEGQVEPCGLMKNDLVSIASYGWKAVVMSEKDALANSGILPSDIQVYAVNQLKDVLSLVSCNFNKESFDSAGQGGEYYY